ncbi:hypothetical protein PG984_005352 [Apiospora sp. TS-2023a]
MTASWRYGSGCCPWVALLRAARSAFILAIRESLLAASARSAAISCCASSSAGWFRALSASDSALSSFSFAFRSLFNWISERAMERRSLIESLFWSTAVIVSGCDFSETSMRALGSPTTGSSLGLFDSFAISVKRK